MHTHELELTKEENVVYQKLLAFSRKALEDYIESQERRAKDGYTFNRQVILTCVIKKKLSFTYVSIS